MNPLLIFLTNFYWLLLPQWLAENLWYADWKGARKRGSRGIVGELFRSVLSLNVYALRVSILAGWSPADVANWLSGYGIATWGWAYDEEWMMFHVRMKQARYAQYLLAWAGLPFD